MVSIGKTICPHSKLFIVNHTLKHIHPIQKLSYGSANYWQKFFNDVHRWCLLMEIYVWYSHLVILLYLAGSTQWPFSNSWLSCVMILYKCQQTIIIQVTCNQLKHNVFNTWYISIHRCIDVCIYIVSKILTMQSLFNYDKLPTMNIDTIFGGKFLFHIWNQVITLLKKKGRLCHGWMMMICAYEVETTWVICLSKEKPFRTIIQYEDIAPEFLGNGVPHQVHDITWQSKSLSTSVGWHCSVKGKNLQDVVIMLLGFHVPPNWRYVPTN